MARQQIYVEEELLKVWELVGELSEQLNNNRALLTQLKSKSENVKGQAAHVGTGFPLRRFNLDISDEEFHSELEAFASHLVLENQNLQHENKQLNGLLKEYEQTLEAVMTKFRSVAHASQQHELSLHSYYTSLLQTLQTAHSSAKLHDDTSLSLLLTRLSTLIRAAMRSLGGEELDFDLSSIPGLSHLHDNAPSPEPSSSPISSSPAVSVTRSGLGGGKVLSTGTTKSIAPPRHAPFPGFVGGDSSGGYIGRDGQEDWALAREIEIERLEAENKELRRMLQIAEQVAVEPVDSTPIEDVKSPEPTTGRRKSSLTMKELEADAEREERQEEDMVREIKGIGGGVSVKIDIADPLASSGILDGGREDSLGALGPALSDDVDKGLKVSGILQRPQIDESVLGFRAKSEGEAPVDEAIDDAEFDTI